MWSRFARRGPRFADLRGAEASTVCSRTNRRRRASRVLKRRTFLRARLGPEDYGVRVDGGAQGRVSHRPTPALAIVMSKVPRRSRLWSRPQIRRGRAQGGCRCGCPDCLGAQSALRRCRRDRDTTSMQAIPATTDEPSAATTSADEEQLLFAENPPDIIGCRPAEGRVGLGCPGEPGTLEGCSGRWRRRNSLQRPRSGCVTQRARTDHGRRVNEKIGAGWFRWRRLTEPPVGSGRNGRLRTWEQEERPGKDSKGLRSRWIPGG